MSAAPSVDLQQENGPAMIAIACGKCHHTNPLSRKFCSGCGQSLWQKCGKCSGELAPNERFCGQCGCDVQEAFEQRLAELESELESARTALAEHRYQDANWQLRDLAKVTDPRFEAITRQAALLLSNLEKKKSQAGVTTESAFQQAKQLFEHYAYEKAVVVLSETPANLRTPEMNQLLAAAQAMRDEMLGLAGEIRETVAAKQYHGLLPKLDRLLTIKPDHPTARKLAEQLRDKVVATARRCLVDHQYEAAATALESIPACVSTVEIKELADKARELACLALAVRTAPLVDETTLAIAQRFAKVAAGNPDVALVQKMQTLATQPHADKRLLIPAWAPPPRRTALGPPVDFLANLPAFPTDQPHVAENLAKHAGSFAVALGLALQGLGTADISINHLPPPEKMGLLGALTAPIGGKRVASSAWGFDLSPSGLKAVKMARDPRTGVLRVLAAECLPHAKTLTSPELEKGRREMSEATLQAFLAKHTPERQDIVVAGMSGHQILGRFFELPPMPAKKAESAIEYEARHQIPVPLDELIWGHAILNPVAGKEADAQPRRVIVSAARRYQVMERVALFEACGIKLDMLQSDCLAVHNAAAQEFFATSSPPVGKEEAICLMDVGVECTNFVITSAQGTWFRSVQQGTHDLVTSMVKRFQLTYPQAELLLREPHRARRLYEVLDNWQSWFEQLKGELVKSIEACQRIYPHQRIRQIYGLGGGFRTFGLLRHLRAG